MKFPLVGGASPKLPTERSSAQVAQAQLAGWALVLSLTGILPLSQLSSPDARRFGLPAMHSVQVQ
jgi:hypothetical protein